MSIVKKSCNHALLALITLVMIAVYAITFAPSVVKAEGEPEAYESTFEIKGEDRSGVPSIYYVNNYSKAFSSIDITLEEYSVDKWIAVDTLTKGMLNKGDKLGFKNVEFDVYYRVSIENGSSVDYSNYVIIKSTGSESGGGSESVGESGSTGSGSTGSGSESESSPSQETCPHDRGWTSADTNGSLKCTLCGFVCDHKANTNTVKKTEDWESEYEKGHKHKYSVTCSVCNHATLNFEDPIEPHDYNGGKVEYASDDQHRLTCTKCGYNTLQKCDYEVKKAEYCSDSSFPDAAAKGHNATLVCKICGHEERVTQEKHNLVNGVCTVCGWKKVTPGKVTGVKIKKSVKRQNKSFGGYWRGLTWVKKTTKAYKICKATIRFKKAKNAAFYVIEKTPKTDTTVADSWTIKTTKLTKEMWFMGNAKKATFKITPYSKEGVKGKTFKKTIKL